MESAATLKVPQNIEMIRAIVVGIASLIVVAPALWEAVRIYIVTRLNYVRLSQSIMTASEVSQTIQRYFEFPWRTVPLLAARYWLIGLASLGAAIGLLKRNKMVIACLMWTAVLYLIGNAYMLDLPFIKITNMGAVLVMLYLPIGLVIGAATEKMLTLVGSHRQRIIQIVTVLILVAGFIASHVRVTEIESFRYFVTPEDVTAMEWIKKNTPPDALFAVNTYFWLPYAPHGTDAGYWISYFTGRRTTTSVMLSGLGTVDYMDKIVEMSRLEEELKVDSASLAELRAMGVDYVYVGRMGDFSGPGLDATRLAQAENASVLYQNDGVSILQIKPPDKTD